jgi:hypothetical protein
VSFQPYFKEAYYRKEIPVWDSYAPGLFAEPGADNWLLLRVLALALGVGMLGGLLIDRFGRRRR